MTRRMWVVVGLVATTAFAAALIAGLAASSQTSAVGAVHAKADSDSLKDTPGGGEGLEGAAAQEAAARAYPAEAVPFQLTANAQKAWAQFKGRANGRGKNSAGNWTLAGPANANMPGVLTFSGADYTTSGRITALAIDPNCSQSKCRAWAGAAGGGVWRTNNALSGNGTGWTFVSGSFATNAIGTLTYDAASGTLFAGTGEPNASGDSEAGFGIYKSTDGGDTWTKLAGLTSVPAETVDCGAIFGPPFGVATAPAYSGPAFDGRAIGSIAVDGNTLYVGSARAVRGNSSVTGGTVSLAPGLPPYGLWKSTDGGATFALLNSEASCLNPTTPGNAGIVQSSFGSTRGVTQVALDPSSSSTVYAAAFPRNNSLPVNTGGGVWRSTDAGATWTQIKPALNPAQNTDRAAFAVTKLANGKTRMYVGVGNALITAANQARFYRSDDVATGAPTFNDLTTSQNLNYCGSQAVGGAQCWYDNVVYSPPGHPDQVYIGGAYDYDTYGFASNGRAFLRSTDAGVSFTDMTWDATTAPNQAGQCCNPNAFAPNGMHPDEHAIVAIPGTDSAIFGSDGGLVRTSGSFADISGQCDSRPLGPVSMARCKQLLSAVPTQLYNLNKGLSTLQFQSLSVAADNPKHLQGGTQDNGTFETTGSSVVWPQIMYGDGGQSGFSATNSALRFNTFTGQTTDANFQNGDPTKWVIIGGPIVSSPESALFYAPVLADPNPANAGTIYQGSNSVWRTQDWGGNQAFLEANCPEFTTSSSKPTCGDFVRIGPAGKESLTASNAADYRGTSRSGGNVAAIERGSDTSTMWAATSTGRVFISKNADAAAGGVTYTRLDSLAANSPGRFVSGLYVDQTNSNHAWITYSSYSTITPATPGHVFSVTFNPAGGTATWTNLDGSGPSAFPDFPATDVVADSNGDVYASNDWGVLRLPSGSSAWEVAGAGLPQVETAGLTIVPGARKLYAATHGRSAWQLTLP
jgi:hypothetical protein